ncbi:protein-L-isoaspartate O-methyltransferase [Ephemerocybe angulata]|uniref:Protein-L-isoaspartate O-methyltransferase n=1 Tax=Ephemerocybe angulata TaxID=980116 RepID=A0A8H6M9R7_9AGAR|nr:protein-L-isoaspartate O-methyltransferase [Tulosesus angulatus]
MAWRSIGTSKEELFSNLCYRNLIHSDPVEKAMKAVDRANYVRDKRDVHAYDDLPQSIGFGVTISAPHMHAFAVEHLLDFLHPGARVLDIGSGSGCLVAVMHRLVGDTGKVVGIERIPELVIRSKRNLRQDGLGHALDSGAIEMVAGDGRDGYAPGGPYDAIHVGISATATVPQVMLDQLASPGRMLIPVVGPFMQEAIEEIEKDKDGNVTRRKVMDICYVTLT